MGVPGFTPEFLFSPKITGTAIWWYFQGPDKYFGGLLVFRVFRLCIFFGTWVFRRMPGYRTGRDWEWENVAKWWNTYVYFKYMRRYFNVFLMSVLPWILCAYFKHLSSLVFSYMSREIETPFWFKYTSLVQNPTFIWGQGIRVQVKTASIWSKLPLWGSGWPNLQIFCFLLGFLGGSTDQHGY